MIRLKTPKILLATVLVASSIAAFAQTNGSAPAANVTTTTTPAATMADAPPKMIKRKARADRN